MTSVARKVAIRTGHASETEEAGFATIRWEDDASEKLDGGRVPGANLPPISGGTVFRSFGDASRNSYELMTQTAEYGLCGCRIDFHPRLRTLSEICAAGKRGNRSQPGLVFFGKLIWT